MTNIVLVNRSDTQLYDSIYQYLMQNLDQDELKKDIEFQYYPPQG